MVCETCHRFLIALNNRRPDESHSRCENQTAVSVGERNAIFSREILGSQIK